MNQLSQLKHCSGMDHVITLQQPHPVLKSLQCSDSPTGGTLYLHRHQYYYYDVLDENYYMFFILT